MTLKGDRLQPARRVLVDAQGRAYTHRANPAPSSGGHQRPPWLSQVWQEYEPETDPAQAGVLTDRLNRLQAITAQTVQGVTRPLELRLERERAHGSSGSSPRMQANAPTKHKNKSSSTARGRGGVSPGFTTHVPESSCRTRSPLAPLPGSRGRRMSANRPGNTKRLRSYV